MRERSITMTLREVGGRFHTFVRPLLKRPKFALPLTQVVPQRRRRPFGRESSSATTVGPILKRTYFDVIQMLEN